jgi:hypothetical protein
MLLSNKPNVSSQERSDISLCQVEQRMSLECFDILSSLTLIIILNELFTKGTKIFPILQSSIRTSFNINRMFVHSSFLNQVLNPVSDCLASLLKFQMMNEPSFPPNIYSQPLKENISLTQSQK